MRESEQDGCVPTFEVCPHCSHMGIVGDAWVYEACERHQPKVPHSPSLGEFLSDLALMFEHNMQHRAARPEQVAAKLREAAKLLGK